MIRFNNELLHINGNDEEGNNKEHIVTQSVKSFNCFSMPSHVLEVICSPKS